MTKEIIEPLNQDEELPELIKGKFRVEWTYIGEGINGDFNKEDQNDVPLLRFYVSELNDEGEWDEIGSYCTLFPLNTTKEDQEKALVLIMNRVETACHRESGIRHELEELSWIDPSWLIQ